MIEPTKKIDYQEMVWDVLAILWRRKLFVIIPGIIGICISLYLVKTLPKIYESSTLILVEGQKVPDSIVKSAVSGSAQDRLSTIQQQVLSRSFLQRVIDKFGLYEAQDVNTSYFQRIKSKLGITHVPATAGAKIKLMRQSIQVKTKGRNRLNSFSVSYQGRDPSTVMNVTNELASAVIEENLKIREGFIEGATDFLNIELEGIKGELERQERQIGDYKKRHLGELPGQLDSNLRALDRFQTTLDAMQISKKTSRDRLIELGGMLDGAKRRLVEMNRTSDLFNIPIDSANPISLSSRQRLAALRQSLSNLLMEYSENYPDVKMLRGNIRSLEQQIAQSELTRKMQSPPPDSNIEMGQGLEAEAVITLQGQIRKETKELDYILKREKEIQAEIQIYENRVENTPQREQDMVIMSRDYDNTAANYQSLLNKKLNAQISENLEKRQKGEQFRIIDSANLPEKPIKPNKMLIALMGIFGGLGLGLGAVFVREQLDNSIRKSAEVERITSSLVLAEIPDFSVVMTKSKKVVNLEAFSDRKKRRRHKGMGG